MRARLRATQATVRPHQRVPQLSIPRPRIALAGVATACAAAALAFVLLPGGRPAPTASQLAALWTLPPTQPAPKVDSARPSQLAVSFHGTAFPNYRDHEGWHAAGTRSDVVDGHATETVVYAIGARHAAYTIVHGSVVLPSHALHRHVRGLDFSIFREGDHWVLVFRRDGNTCVLTAAAPRERSWIVKLANWPAPRVQPA
jgi:hypothetical protein